MQTSYISRTPAQTSLLPKLSQTRIPSEDTLLRQESRMQMDVIIDCLLAGMRICIKKPVIMKRLGKSPRARKRTQFSSETDE